MERSGDGQVDLGAPSAQVRRRRVWLAWASLSVLVLAVVALTLDGCSSDENASTTSTTTTAPGKTTGTSPTSTPATPSTPPPTGKQSAPDLSQADVAVIAHRGASGYAPEHTFAAYDLAVEQGADYLEQDLQLTKDGQLVVLHDPTLDRTARGPAADCTGAVGDKTLEQLGACEVGSWFNEAHPDRADPAFAEERIPTLAQVLDRYGPKVRYYIEVKAPEDQPGIEDALLDLLATAELHSPDGDLPPVVIQSFSADSLRRIHERRPDLPLVQLIGANAAPDGAALDGAALDEIARYAVGIGPASVLVDQALVDAADERCLDVHPYTVDDPAEMARLLALGVGGMFTDTPDRLVEARTASTTPADHCPPPAAHEG
jgi:glycerophosphoryl diester phosphodiesterase